MQRVQSFRGGYDCHSSDDEDDSDEDPFADPFRETFGSYMVGGEGAEGGWGAEGG